MEETQRLDYDDEEEEEEETSANRDTPVGNLHMFAGIHGPAQDFPIYRGQNLIGRHASCDITLPAQSVSKKHAILEARGDCHTICDNGSLNKTRRGKAALAPHVNYALSGGDFLLFADVACRYTIEPKVDAESTGVDDSSLVPATQGALAIEKTPSAAIRRIAQGAVLARDSGDEDDEEGGCGPFKDGHKTSGPGTIFPPDTDTIVPESDEENDTATSETRHPSLNPRCDSDTDTHDTSRRSSFVPSSQNISTPLVLKDQSKHDGRTSTAIDKEEMKSSKPTDAEIKLRLAVEENQEEQKVESTSGGSVSEPCVETVGTVDGKLKNEQECEKVLQEDASKKPSSEMMPVSRPSVEEDNVASSTSETVQEAPCVSSPEDDALVQHVKLKEDHVSLDSEWDIQEGDTTTSRIEVNTAETSKIETNKTEEEGKGRSLGSSDAGFHMDSDTDEDEAATTGADLEKAKSHQVADIEKPENNASVPLTGRNEGDSDSDTDVEGDQNVLKATSDNKVNTVMSDPSKTEGSAGLGMDSDDAHMPKLDENITDQDSRSNTEEKKEEFNLDSDTDVEEDVSTAEVKTTEPESSKASVKEIKDVFNLDSDTDVDEDVSSRDVTHGPQDMSTASTNVQEATGVDSDTDVDEDDQKPGGLNATLEKTSTDDGQRDKTPSSDVVMGKETAGLHMDSDTDVDDDDGVVEHIGAPESATHTDGAKKDTEMIKEAAEMHLDSDTDVEEGDESSAVSRQAEDSVDNSGLGEEAGGEDQKSSLSSANESATVSGISTEETRKISIEEEETQKSDSESDDLEMMPTQCYLDPEEESDLQDEEEATQAFIFSSTWTEPDPFKRPADPIGLLQISSVTVNASEEEIDENATAEMQDFCTEAEPRRSNVEETPEPVKRSVDETIRSPGSEEESGKEVQQLSHETMSPDATQPVSQDLSTRPPQEIGTWLHLKRDVPASVWLRGIRQEGDTADLERGNETENATQADEQSLNLELEATQSYVVENPSQKPPAQTEIPIVPIADEDKAPDVSEKPTERTEQPCSEDTLATDDDATQAYSLHVLHSERGTTQACSLSEEATGDGVTRAIRIHTVATEDDNTQVVKPSGPAAEEIVPETSTESKETLSSRRGLSGSRKKKEPTENIPQTSSDIEEHPDKASAGPGSPREDPDEQSAGEPQLSAIKEGQVEKGVRRRGGRRIAESQANTTAKEDVLVATTSRKRTSKISAEAESSAINKQHGRKQVSRKSAIKVVHEEEHEQSGTNTEEIKESFAPEILPENPPEDIESLTSKDDRKVYAVESGDQASLEDKDILGTEASTSSIVIEGKEFMESNDSAEEESDSRHIKQSKKPAKNKRRVATRLKNEAESIDDVEKDENKGDDNLRTFQDKDTSKQTSEPLQSQQITREESRGRKATRKSRVTSSEPDKGEDTTASATEENKVEEICPADPVSGSKKSRRTRTSLKEEINEESENIKEGKEKRGRRASGKDVEPKHKEKGNVENMPESRKITKRTRNNSKDTPKTEQDVKEDVKIKENEGRKSRRTQKNLKEEPETEDNIGTKETSSSNAQTSRARKGTVKEETGKEAPSRRTRRHSKEDEVVKLEEDQTKKSRRTRKDSKEEAKTEETVEERLLEEDKEETVGRKITRKTRKNLKDDEKTNVHESKPTEDDSKSKRSPRTRAKASDKSSELHGEAEESPKLSPHEAKSKPAVGRGRRAATKEDLPQVSTPVASRKRGQTTKPEVEVKRKKSEEEEEQEKLVVETPKSRRGRPRKLVTETANTQTGKEIPPPDPSPSRSAHHRPSSAVNNPPEARTPRRTNRVSTSATATSPRVAQSAPKILFTGVVDTAGEEAIRALGGDIAESVFDCTHLVTDRVRRTVKFLCALARGIPIVTLDWIDKCKKSGCFLSPAGFLVNDKEQEKNFNFMLSESLQKAKRRPLFEGYEIHVTANVKPEPENMKDIISCSGATFLPKMPRSFKEKCVIVSCPEDAARCKSVPASVPITSAEFILSGILHQEVNPTAYLLNPAAPGTGATPAKRRR